MRRVKAEGNKLCLVLPYPPTANHSYATVNKRRVLTQRGKDYRAAVAAEVLAKRCKQLSGWIHVSILLSPPDRRKRDIDNPVKPLLDALTKAGVWSDDSQIKFLEVGMVEPVKGGRCSLVIRDSVPADLVGIEVETA